MGRHPWMVVSGLMKNQVEGKTKRFERRLILIIASVVILFLFAMGWWYFHNHPISLSDPKQNETPRSLTNIPNYVDNETCLSCHKKEAREWMHSHHYFAMQEATSKSVLGDFHDAVFTRQGVKTKFFIRDNKYYIHTEGPDGKMGDFEVKYTFGVDPLQQYLVALPGGRLQSFTIAWDDVGKKWFDLYAKEKTPPGDTLHWTGRYQNANMMCIGCHTTDYHKNFHAATNTYHSTWSAINVSCQACHGPGEHHIAWTKDRNKKFPGEHYGLIVNFKNNSQNVVETCGTCHARRGELTTNPIPGQPLLNNYLPTNLNADLYHADGQQLAEVYVYNSFRQSKMYQMGVSCIDCHNPHTGKLKLEGNAVCTQCHNPFGDSRFRSAAGLYNSPKHTFHPVNSAGSQCVNCHMPSKKYMMMQNRPDHSIRIPRPDLTIKYGVPNACNSCHTNKSPEWALDAITQWYGPLKESKNKHYCEVFAQARSGDPDAEDDLINIAKNVNYPAVVRATAIDTLQNYGPKGNDAIVNAARSPDPALRRSAITAMGKLPVSARINHVARYLNDPILGVRVEAVRVLSTVPEELLTAEQLAAYRKGQEEYLQTEKTMIDMPGPNLNLAVMSENNEEPKIAIEYYKVALSIDPDFMPARLNLARLYNSLERNDEAEMVLREGIAHDPQQGELYYSLGLLLAEEKKMDQAAEALSKAATLMPTRPRVLYNYAITLEQTGEHDKAIQVLNKAHQLAPNDVNIYEALKSLGR